MNTQDLALLQAWVEGERKALEWDVREGERMRTFQICGLSGAEGYWERFFRANTNPIRRRVGESEIIDALERATSPLEFYRGEKGSGEFFPNAEAALNAARKWCGQN